MTRIIALACLSLAFVGHAAAAEETAPGVTVEYRPAALESAQGAQALHQRLERAARTVCRTGAPASTETAATEKGCRKEALDRAVQTVDAPRLTAAHRDERPYLLARGGEGA